VRWHSQIILHETLYDEFDLGSGRVMFETFTAELHDLGESADALFESLPGSEEMAANLESAMAELAAIVEVERARLLAEVDRQRGLIFHDVTEQREAIMRDVEAQIVLAQERIELQVDDVFTRIEALTDNTVHRSFGESERLINLLYRRVLVLLLVAIGGGAGLILLGKWRRPFGGGAGTPAS
jgi:hypothetical protein